MLCSVSVHDRHHHKSENLAHGLNYGNKFSRDTHGRVIKIGYGHGHHGEKHRHHQVAGRHMVGMHRRHGGGITPHNRPHSRLLRDLINSHGGEPENVTHEEKDLANMAAHRNMNALDKLYKNGAISKGTVDTVLAETTGTVPFSTTDKEKGEIQDVISMMKKAQNDLPGSGIVDPQQLAENLKYAPEIQEKMENLKGSVLNTAKKAFTRHVFKKSLEVTGSPEKALLEANKAAALVDAYDSGIKNGLSPNMAYEEAMGAAKYDSGDVTNIVSDDPVAQSIVKNAQEDLKHMRDHFPNKRKTSALNLLSKIKVENAIMDANKENEQMRDLLLKAQEKADENNVVKNTEEKLATVKENQIIESDGEKAFAQAYERTGDVVEAGLSRSAARSETRNRLSQERSERREQVANMLSRAGVEGMAAKEAAEHIATAHAGLNVVGSSIGDLEEKYTEEVNKQASMKKLSMEAETSNIHVKDVIPPTTSTIGIINGEIKFPLKGFSSEEPKTAQEALIQSKQKVRRNQVRNKVIGSDVESGLNVVKTKNGFIHISEAAKALKVDKGTIFYSEDAKGLMEKQNMDTSMLKHKFNTGEISEGKGVGYYEADVSGFSLSLPSPSNPIPTSVMTDGVNILNVEHALSMRVDSGEISGTPWTEFVENVRPSINGTQLQDKDVMEASEVKARIENEKKIRNLEGIKTEIYTNSDGSRFVEVSPPYGVAELMSMDKAVESLDNVGSSNVTAVSDELNRKDQNLPLNMATTAQNKSTEESFMSDVFSRVSKTGESLNYLSRENSFNGKAISEKASIIDKATTEVINKYMASTSETTEGAVKKMIMSKAEGYSRNMKTSVEKFLKIISEIPESSIREMMSYSQTQQSSRKDIMDTQFYSQISSVLQNHWSDVNSVIETIFSAISVVTGQPNSVGGEILERITVPNLKAIERIETEVTPGKGVTETSVLVHNNPGTQILGEFKLGNPVPDLSSNRSSTVPTANSVTSEIVYGINNDGNNFKPGTWMGPDASKSHWTKSGKEATTASSNGQREVPSATVPAGVQGGASKPRAIANNTTPKPSRNENSANPGYKTTGTGGTQSGSPSHGAVTSSTVKSQARPETTQTNSRTLNTK